MSESNQTNFKPAPGYVLGKPVTWDQVAKKAAASSLVLPDQVGKMKDAVGVAEVISLGAPGLDDLKLLQLHSEMDNDGFSLPPAWKPWEELKPGDLIAYIPFTDAIIPQGLDKNNMVPYKNIMASYKAAPEVKGGAATGDSKAK